MQVHRAAHKRAVLFFLFLFVLSLPFVLATFSLDVDDFYDSGDTVSVSVFCDEGTAALQLMSGFDTIAIEQAGSSDLEVALELALDDGEYTAFASCDGASVSKTFCVGDPAACPGVDSGDPGVEGDIDPDDGSDPGDGSSPSGRGGYSGSCDQNLSCSPWSFCGPDLVKTRSCVDLNDCGDEIPEEETVLACDACDQSWICSTWGTCSGSINTRDCVDEHACGTTSLKPALTKACSASDASGPQPVRISSDLTPPSVTAPPAATPPATQQPSVETESFSDVWEENKALFIALPIILLLIGLLIFYFVRKAHGHHGAENMGQLNDYVAQERAAGIADNEIEASLGKAGWTGKEISSALKK